MRLTRQQIKVIADILEAHGLVGLLDATADALRLLEERNRDKDEGPIWKDEIELVRAVRKYVDGAEV